MKNFALGILIAMCLVPCASAKMCTIDNVPAATLLLPYFEVDLDQADGLTTLFSINNADPEPVLSHVTLWTDWGWPSIDFDVFLTGYDVVTVNLRDVFNGNIPITADEQSDPDDLVSPHGDHPNWDGSYADGPDCLNFFPFFINPVISGANLDRLVSGHTGVGIASLGGQCVGSATGDNHARGYLTIDSVGECSTDFPSDPGYFNGSFGVANFRNSLWGDYSYFDPAGDTLQSLSMVHIEADPNFDHNSTPSGATFYGRYATNGGDHREPLSEVWGTRYLSFGSGFDTEIVVWRDPGTAAVAPVDCGSSPPWAPLEQNEVVCFNTEEDFVDVCTGDQCAPLETQKLSLADGDLPAPYAAGFCRLDLGLPGQYAQSYVSFGLQTTTGQFFSSGAAGMPLASACDGATAPVTAGGVR